MIKGLIFDCDGTLADTMLLHWRAWEAVLRRHPLQLTRERFYALGGIPSRDILKLLSQEQGIPLDYLAVSRENEVEYLPLIAQVEPVNTIVGIAREHHGKLPLAVASDGLRRTIECVLNHLGIRHLFDTVVTSEDVARQKPAPDIFLEAARRSITRLHSWLARSRGWAEPASRALVLGLLYYTDASIALDAFGTRWRMGDSYVTSMFGETLAFENPRPQVNRVLTPLVIRAVSAAVPAAVAEVLSPRSDLIRAWYGIESGNDLEYAVAYYLLFACLVGSMLAWRAAIAAALTGPRWIRDVAPVLAMLLYPMSFMRGGYIYDAPALFLSLACFAVFLKLRWWCFY